MHGRGVAPAMKISRPPLKRLLRDVSACLTVGVFFFPILWWGYMSLAPYWVIFNKDQLPFFNFAPTLENYQFAYFSHGPEAFSASATLMHSLIIASASTVLAVSLGLMGAFGITRVPLGRRRNYTATILALRILPPIAIIVPATVIFRRVGLFDSHASVIIMHATMTLPLALLMLVSFMDELPAEVYDAARIDGATEVQLLFLIVTPMVQGGIAATAILCFIFSLVEFLMSLFLTVSFRTLPVSLSFLPWGDMGTLAASSMSAIVPSFVFVWICQRHLVRGLTLGSQK
jgi:multiple sugar transport system permease protein